MKESNAMTASRRSEYEKHFNIHDESGQKDCGVY